MDDYYPIPMTSDHKLGLGLSSLDIDSFQFPTSCAELGHEQLLALDDPQSFCLAFPDTDVFGTAEESVSRTSTVVTPQSECSSRTNLSGRNISPSSDIMSFHDHPTQDLESIIQDTTHSIISNRQSRGGSVAWSQSAGDSLGLNGNMTPSRHFSHRPQSFSYRTPQMSQLESQTPPPSAYFASPSLQPVQQPSATQSPFLSPNMQSPMMSGQNLYMQATNMSPSQSSYFPIPQSQLPPHPQYQQAQHAQVQAFQMALQRSQASGQPPPRRPLQANPNTSMMQSFFSSQSQQQPSPFPSSNNSTSSSNNNNNNNTNHATALPNTTGNSTTGYQCFSHGCGGRHFSNWGNLVRHHRERQLRSKVGAKPTCARCGKGFTRSSARDAHVAGLKCVLGRRRRAATGGSAATAATAADGDAKSDTADKQDDNNSNGDSDGGRDDDSGSLAGRKTRDSSEDAEAVDDEDGAHAMGRGRSSFSSGGNADRHMGSFHEGFDTAGLVGDMGPAYLAPQHLEFN